MSAFLRRAAVRLALDALHFTGACRLLRNRCRGTGLILALHRVRPPRSDVFQPNRALEITPDFLDQMVVDLRQRGLQFVSLDQLHCRLQNGELSERVVCLTFDDGYRDNLQWAYPILKRHNVPFAIFVTSDFADQRGHLWWCTLEAAVSAQPELTIRVAGVAHTFFCRTPGEKQATIDAIHDALGRLPTEAEVRALVDDIALCAKIDTRAHCAATCMSWTELASIAIDPLVTIGAHTVTHPRLRKLPPEAAQYEMEVSATRIEEMLGIRPRHFAYPFGDASAVGAREFSYAEELGFHTALTTRPGVIEDRSRLRLNALPRISLNGHFQKLRYLHVLDSGVPTALRDLLHQLTARYGTASAQSDVAPRIGLDVAHSR